MSVIVKKRATGFVLKNSYNDNVYLQFEIPLEREDQPNHPFTTAEIKDSFQSSAKALLGQRVSTSVKYETTMESLSSSYRPTVTDLTIKSPS